MSLDLMELLVVFLVQRQFCFGTLVAWCLFKGGPLCILLAYLVVLLIQFFLTLLYIKKKNIGKLLIESSVGIF